MCARANMLRLCASGGQQWSIIICFLVQNEKLPFLLCDDIIKSMLIIQLGFHLESAMFKFDTLVGLHINAVIYVFASIQTILGLARI